MSFSLSKTKEAAARGDRGAIAQLKREASRTHNRSLREFARQCQEEIDAEIEAVATSSLPSSESISALKLSFTDEPADEQAPKIKVERK